VNIKKYLNQAFYMQRLIESNKLELTRLRELAASVGTANLAGDRVQSGGRSDRTGDLAASIADLEAEIKSDIRRCVKIMSDIRWIIKSVDDERLRLILQSRFLDFKSWEQIRMTLGLSDARYLFRLYKLALKEAEIIYPRVKKSRKKTA
jgi:hypothetical protein